MNEIISKIILQSEKKVIRVKFKRHEKINKKCNDFLKEQKKNKNNKKYEK